MFKINYKLYSIHIKKKVLLSIFNKIENKFWPVDYTFTTEQFNNIQKLYKLTRFVSKIYVCNILCTCFGYCFSSPFQNEHHLINNIWIPDFISENKMYLFILLITQFICLNTSTIAGLMTFDQMFLLGIASGIAQLKLIKYRLRSVGMNGNDEQVIIQCVNHHNMMFEFFNDIEELSSAVILQMLGTNIIMGVVVLFVFSIEENISQLFPYFSIIISVAIQLYMYCLLGQFIQDETESVADAAYGASWENIPNRNIRMGILLIIQRSHKYAKISMGGFLILCLENFTRVARMMLSVLTLIVNMRKE